MKSIKDKLNRPTCLLTKQRFSINGALPLIINIERVLFHIFMLRYLKGDIEK
jgi:hypothetical protein